MKPTTNRRIEIAQRKLMQAKHYLRRHGLSGVVTILGAVEATVYIEHPADIHLLVTHADILVRQFENHVDRSLRANDNEDSDEYGYEENGVG